MCCVAYYGASLQVMILIDDLIGLSLDDLRKINGEVLLGLG